MSSHASKSKVRAKLEALKAQRKAKLKKLGPTKYDGHRGHRRNKEERRRDWVAQFVNWNPNWPRAKAEAIFDEIEAKRALPPAIVKIEGDYYARRVDTAGGVFWTDHLTFTGLRRRGWTTFLIDKLLGNPEQLRNARFAADMKLYKVNRVVDAEKTGTWQAHRLATAARQGARS